MDVLLLTIMNKLSVLVFIQFQLFNHSILGFFISRRNLLIFGFWSVADDKGLCSKCLKFHSISAGFRSYINKLPGNIHIAVMIYSGFANYVYRLIIIYGN